METELPITTIVGWCGFLAGIVFGAIANRTHFCTMGAISDIVYMGDYRRMRSWMLALAVALIGSQIMHSQGIIDLGQSIYLSATLGLGGAIIGGLLFGFGMVLCGGCANKNLVRMGGGNLKSIVVVLVMGITAYATLRGLTGLVRLEIEGLTNVNLAAFGLESQSMAEILSAVTGLDGSVSRWILTALISGGMIIWCFKDADFRGARHLIFAGLSIGLLIMAGWYITGVIGFDDFDPTPLASFSFVAPAGESIQYLMIFTGTTMKFGIATVGGVIVGSFLAAKASKTFAYETFADTTDKIRHLVGAVLMGFGGVTALGCTIGQGLTGMSTLALGSLVAITSIILGGVYGLKFLEWGSHSAAVRSFFGLDPE